MTNTTLFTIHDLDDLDYITAYSLLAGLWLFCYILVNKKIEQNTSGNQEIQIV